VCERTDFVGGKYSVKGKSERVREKWGRCENPLQHQLIETSQRRMLAPAETGTFNLTAIAMRLRLRSR
jgi:hypothetical protein